MIPTVEQIQSQLSQYRNNAESARATFHSEQAEIRADNRRTETAKQQDLEQSRKAANDRITLQQQKERDYIAATRQKLETEAFGIGSFPSTSEIVAFRDATDRAERLDRNDADKAAEMYQRAVQTGDKTMMTALVTRAYKIGLTGILDQHAQRSPSWGRHLEGLRFLDTLEHNMQAQVTTGFAYAPASLR